MGQIIDHTHGSYANLRQISKEHAYNGAYYYSKEIVRNIIPKVETDRNWVTINRYGAGMDHAIVFIHNNLNAGKYEWLNRYSDLILVCGIPETCPKVAHLGKTIYLPLSVDVAEIEKYKCKKTRDVAFCGRRSKAKNIPMGTDIIGGIERADFLAAMARYRKVYAVGRAAIEAKVLGCEILPYDERFPDPERWEVMDNSEAAYILQKKLDLIDGKARLEK